jgi:hypothetical protein
LTLGLRLHVGKTRIVHLTHGEEGFDFLGFYYRKVESWKQQGCYYLQKWPSDRNMTMIRSKIRDATGTPCGQICRCRSGGAQPCPQRVGQLLSVG